MKFQSALFIVIVALVLAPWVVMFVGCGTPTTTTMPVSPSSRVTIERIGVIEDDLAYNARRGIYVIRDTETGREFIGVSGVGISETGSHTKQQGKTTTAEQDER